MKKIILLICSVLLATQVFSQKIEVGASAIAGFTMVDVEAAMEKTLTDWDQFCYGGIIYGLYHLQENFAVGGEAGFNRLYYWEEFYGFGGYYRWGDISTIHFGPVAELKNNNLFLQAGLNLRIFTNGSGAVPGLMLGGGYKISLSERMMLPVGIRTDIVFGSATPIAFNLILGLRYLIRT